MCQNEKLTIQKNDKMIVRLYFDTSSFHDVKKQTKQDEKTTPL